jgi:hypothetical protein
MTDEFLRAVQQKVAVGSIGPSVLRGQGAPGVAAAAQSYFRTLSLERFAVADQKRFRRALDASTDQLRLRFPKGTQRWGAARKALNIFLRESFYNTYLAREFGLERAERHFEIPLDSYVAKGLRELDTTRSLPRWPLLKGLRPDTSDAYQGAAICVADTRGIARVHLDVELWLAGRSRPAR